MARPLSNVVKFVFTLRHQTSMSLEEAQHYWLSYHGPVWRNSVAGPGTSMRYFQVHRFDHELADQLREARGTDGPSPTPEWPSCGGRARARATPPQKGPMPTDSSRRMSASSST